MKFYRVLKPALGVLPGHFHMRYDVSDRRYKVIPMTEPVWFLPPQVTPCPPTE